MKTMKTRKPGAKPDPTSLRNRCAAKGLNYNTVFWRMKRGWPEKLAMETPVKGK
jgi:hypothetical protein